LAKRGKGRFLGDVLIIKIPPDLPFPKGGICVSPKEGDKEMIRFLFCLRSTLFTIVSLLYVVLCFSSHAYAQESLICADDIDKYCKEIKPGGGRILNCLKAHETELSVSCQGKVNELQGIIKDFEEACSTDISQFCREVQPGGGRIIKCLREHDKELSPSCSAELEMITKKYNRRGE
jgi:Na+-transporting NADH:ubiquinone oxidoreductase subunit NqrF